MELIGSDYLPTLRNFIDDAQIPVDLGGSYQNFVWNWPYPEETLCTPEHIAQYNAARGRGKVHNSENEVVLATVERGVTNEDSQVSESLP